MKIIIDVPYGSKLALDESSAALMPALLTASLVSEEGYGPQARYKPLTDSRIAVSVVQDSQFEEMPEPFKVLQERAAAAEKRWLDQYNEANKQKKRADDLQQKLDAIAAGVAQ